MANLQDRVSCVSERNARQGFLGAKSTEVLANTFAGIVGNCGGGSHVAQQLAHVGIGHFVLIDPDVTEAPNLNRMIGSIPQDAIDQLPKTAVIERMIRAINPAADITTLNSRWQECAIELRSCDVVFGCVDGYMTRSELEGYCRRFLLPYIDIGMDVTQFTDMFAVTGQVMTSLPSRACLRCMGFLTETLLAQEATRYGDAGARPQVVWPNGVLASVAVGISMRLLCPWNREPVCPYLMYDGNRQTLIPSPRLAHIDLRSCRHFPQAGVGDPLWVRSCQSSVDENH
jgi:molybdopterin-synthase adenylyltransferase